MALDIRQLADFLVEAKLKTYAGLDDDASVRAPLIPQSKQLEHRSSAFHYRDIYFGMSVFSGLETVSHDDMPVWSMSYTGGLLAPMPRADMLAVFAFLRRALQLVTKDRPFRGPSRFDADGMNYACNTDGDIMRFHGNEVINIHSEPKYKLHFSGGLLR